MKQKHRSSSGGHPSRSDCQKEEDEQRMPQENRSKAVRLWLECGRQERRELGRVHSEGDHGCVPCHSPLQGAGLDESESQWGIPPARRPPLCQLKARRPLSGLAGLDKGRIVLLVLSFLHAVWGAEAQPAQVDTLSQLRVATCDPGVKPYVYMDGDSIVGYEMEQFAELFPLLVQRVAQVEDPIARQELETLVGRVAPKVLIMSVEDLWDGLTNSTIDLAFCKLTITPERSPSVDFTVPYVDSSLGIITRDKSTDIRAITVFFTAFRRPNAWAIFALLLLLILSIIFAHLLWFSERKENININRAYGPGVFDSWWLGVVTALTVGFGDIVPVTVLGKYITILWMFFSCYCLGLYGAAITTDQIEVTNTQASNTIQSITDLAGMNILITDHTPVGSVEAFLPTAMIRQVGDVPAAISYMQGLQVELPEGDQQTYFVENLQTARHHLSELRAQGYRNLVLSELTFNSHQIALGISRPNGTFHPAYRVINQALVDYMYGPGRQRYLDNLGELLGTAEDYDEDESTKAVASTLANINAQWGVVLLVFVLCWLVFVALHYRREIIQARVKAGLRRAMGLGSKYSGQELEEGASALFARLDTDKSGTLDLNEFLQCLQGLGYTVTEKEVADILNAESEKAGISGIRREASSRSVDLQIDEDKFKHLMQQLLLSETMANNDAELHAPILSKHLQALARDANGELDKISGKVMKALDRMEDAITLATGSGVKLAKPVEGEIAKAAKDNSHRSLPDIAPRNGAGLHPSDLPTEQLAGSR